MYKLVDRYLDPLAADFVSWSAYNYVLGNPVSLVDPDGKAPQTGVDPPPGERIKNFFADLFQPVKEYLGFEDNFLINETFRDEETSRAIANRRAKITELSNAYQDKIEAVQNKIVETADAVGMCGETLETCGDYTMLAGAAITPVAPEIGLPLVEAGNVVSNAGVAMQLLENAIEGDAKSAGKKVLVESLPGVITSPAKKAVKKMEPIKTNGSYKDRSKETLDATIGIGEYGIEQGIDKIINNE